MAKGDDIRERLVNFAVMVIEAEVWLDIVLRKEMAEKDYSLRVREECSVLCRILAASVRTAGRKLSRLNNA